MGYFVVAEFLLTRTSRGLSAIAEPFVILCMKLTLTLLRFWRYELRFYLARSAKVAKRAIYFTLRNFFLFFLFYDLF